MGRSNEARRKERRAARQRRTWLLRGIAALVVIGIIAGAAGLVISSAPPPAEASQEWETIPTQPAVHIESGESYEPYNSDPPTSGYHYGSPMQPVVAGFYEEQIAQDENLVHSLEHGYVFLWYDCSQVSEVECEEIKDGIERVVTDSRTYKVVGMPREGMDAPIIATSWGVMYKQQEFDYALLMEFVRANREQSPEPNSP